MLKTISNKYASFLLIIFSIYWIIMAFNVHERYMWFIENVLMFIFLTIILITYRKFKFSALSYTLFFLFLILQTIGAHYTYRFVPFDWVTNTFHFERNNYDRLVHFSYGFLLAFPIRELFIKITNTKNILSFLIPIQWALGTGALYEIIEWLFAILSNEGESNAFLGSQGDIWDAQADMALAGLGALIAMIITWIIIKIKNKKKT